MKLYTPPNKRTKTQSGFTLIEMIGVLAVIAILAALLIPKVFSAIADAKVNNAVVSTETIKTAVADHYGKYGKFDTLFGTTPMAAPINGYDTNVLMPENLIDKPYQTKLGTNWCIQVIAANAPGAVPGTADASYSLDGNGTNNAYGQFVVQAIIYGVAEADAQAISQRIDGLPLSVGIGTATGDTVGRVKYAHPAAAGDPTDVYIYLTAR